MQVTQVATSTPLPTPGTIVPGQRIARAEVPSAPFTPGSRATVDITAGRVLMTGISDVQDAAAQLKAATFDLAPGHTWGLVGFVRTDDTWAAVELLGPTADGTRQQLWSPYGIRHFAVADGVQLDAIFQVSHYGSDTRWGTPESIIRPGA